MIFLFNKTVKNIFCNCLPYETVTFADRDTASKVSKYGVSSGPYFPVFAPEKTPYLDTFHAVRCMKCINMLKENQDLKVFNNIKCLQNELNSIIDSNKQNHYSRLSNKLIDPMTSSKVYWSTLKMFLNNNKIPCIPSLSHQNKYVTDFKEKAEIFNSFFPEQCCFLNNSNKLLSAFLKRTEKVLSSISLSSNDIAKII